MSETNEMTGEMMNEEIGSTEDEHHTQQAGE